MAKQSAEFRALVADAMARHAVASATHGNWKLRLAGERDRCDDVVDVDRPDDHLRPPVEQAVERRSRGVIAAVIQSDYRPAVDSPEGKLGAQRTGGVYPIVLSSGNGCFARPTSRGH